MNSNDTQPLDINHTTTPQILRQTASLFCNHFAIFLFLSSLLFTFHSNVHTASQYLYSLIDRNADLKTLLTRLDYSDNLHGHRHRRRRPFLHFSRVGTLDEDFFSSDSHFDRHLHNLKAQPNASVLFLNTNYAFPDNVIDNGIYFPSLVRPGVLGFRSLFLEDKVDNFEGGEEEKEIARVESALDDVGGHGGGDSIVDLSFFVKGLDFGNWDATSLFFLAGVFVAAYSYLILAFIVSYTWIGGIVFVKVLDSLLGKYRSFFRTVWDGSNVGMKRLPGLILMKWAVRDAVVQLVGIYFMGEIEEQYVFFKVFLRMKLMPFANVAPWVIGHERESIGFILVWFFCDLVVGFVFSVDSWVAIVDSRRNGREIIKEGFHMLLSLFRPAFEIRLMEAILCGAVGRWILRRMCGEAIKIFFQSLMEVYFLVAWLVFYLAARQKDDASLGMIFGRRELQALLDVAR